MAGNGYPAEHTRSASPTAHAIQRTASPPRSPETERNPYFSSAVLVLKGAAITAMGIPAGRSTASVKPLSDLTGRLTLAGVSSFPSKAQRSQLARLVDEKVFEDRAFRTFRASRAVAEDMYGDAMYDASESIGAGTPEEVLRLVSLSEWGVSVQPNAVIRSTALLGRLELTGFKHNNLKGQFDISFAVHPASADPPAVAEETKVPPFPTIAELVPKGSAAGGPMVLSHTAPGPEAGAAATGSCAPPAFPYPGESASKAQVEYWEWFRRALGRHFQKALASAGRTTEDLLKDPSLAGVCRTCAEVLSSPLSETEVAHLQLVPITADWLQQTVELR